MDTAKVRELDAAHYMHPFTDTKALGEKGVRVMVRGEGIPGVAGRLASTRRPAVEAFGLKKALRRFLQSPIS